MMVQRVKVRPGTTSQSWRDQQAGAPPPGSRPPPRPPPVLRRSRERAAGGRARRHRPDRRPRWREPVDDPNNSSTAWPCPPPAGRGLDRRIYSGEWRRVLPVSRRTGSGWLPPGRAARTRRRGGPCGPPRGCGQGGSGPQGMDRLPAVTSPLSKPSAKIGMPT